MGCGNQRRLMLMVSWIVSLTLAVTIGHAQQETNMTDQLPENVYVGDLVSYPGAWGLGMGRTGIILVSDQELEMLSDPDRKINLSLNHEPREESLREVCEKAQTRGARTRIVAFDHFFRQYRPGQDQPRRYMPDMDEYIDRIAAISRFAEQYGLGLELSLLSPLEIGPAYQKSTGESGVWMHYRKGLRDPRTGDFSVQMWRQQQWVNNKGLVPVEDAGIRVFAFREEPIGGTPYRVVRPEWIQEITDVAQVEIWDGTVEKRGDYQAQRIRVNGQGDLIAFAGNQCRQITIDGKTTIFSEEPLALIAWAPIPEERQVEGGATAQILVRGEGSARVPTSSLPEDFQLIAEGSTPGSRGTEVVFQREADSVVIEVEGDAAGGWLYVVPTA